MEIKNINGLSLDHFSIEMDAMYVALVQLFSNNRQKCDRCPASACLLKNNGRLLIASGVFLPGVIGRKENALGGDRPHPWCLTSNYDSGEASFYPDCLVGKFLLGLEPNSIDRDDP